MPIEGETVQVLIVELDGLRHRLDDLLRDVREIGKARELRQHHDELVAADAADRVAGAQLLGEALRHFLQHRVARGVPRRIVDRLEAVEVDEHHRGLLAVALAERERLGQPVFEQPPVRQVR